MIRSHDTTLELRPSDRGVTIVDLASSSRSRNWVKGSDSIISLPTSAGIGGRKIPLEWSLENETRTGERTISFTFACRPLRLHARSTWKGTAGNGPIEHFLSIENQESRPVELPNQPTLIWSGPLTGKTSNWWVEKAAGRPSDVGVHTSPIDAKFHLDILSRPYMDDTAAYTADGSRRDPIPWVCVHDEGTREGWYAGIEFSGRSLISQSMVGEHLRTWIGLAPDPESGNDQPQTRLSPGEVHLFPPAFVGCFQGSVDDGCNRLRHWVDSELRPPATDSRYPLLTLNSWGSGMAIDERLGLSMARNAKQLGLEMFHVDAGWFRSVGDWRSNPAKFPNGLPAFADEVHALGLKFGLWVGWTQGGIGPEAEDPVRVVSAHSESRSDWFAADFPPDWKPADFVGADLCLGDPQAVTWCTDLLSKLVADYHLDMLEHDQRMIVDQCQRTDHLHTASPSDISYRAAEGYYRVYDAVRAGHPDLLFEDCVNGGRMVDFGSARRAHYFSIVDSYDPLSNRRAFWDVSYVLPPAMCECYVMKMPVKTLDEFKAMLRSGMMGWFTLMQNPADWTPEQFEAAKAEFETYKTRLRPLIRTGNLYHVSDRPDGVHWDGIQYASPDGKRAVLFAFRGTGGSPVHRFQCEGLLPAAHYRIELQDARQPEYDSTGQELMAEGLQLKLPEPGTSQIVFLTMKP